jgi:hypothetical protein
MKKMIYVQSLSQWKTQRGSQTWSRQIFKLSVQELLSSMEWP